jgi:hypothetical protein
MTALSNLNVLVVDLSGLEGSELSKIFANACAKTHVASSYATAIKLFGSTQIDAAVLKFSDDEETVAFCKTLSEMNIPFVFASEPPPRYLKRKPRSEAIVAIQSMLVQQAPKVPKHHARH